MEFLESKQNCFSEVQSYKTDILYGKVNIIEDQFYLVETCRTSGNTSYFLIRTERMLQTDTPTYV